MHTIHPRFPPSSTNATSSNGSLLHQPSREGNGLIVKGDKGGLCNQSQSQQSRHSVTQTSSLAFPPLLPSLAKVRFPPPTSPPASVLTGFLLLRQSLARFSLLVFCMRLWPLTTHFKSQIHSFSYLFEVGGHFLALSLCHRFFVVLFLQLHFSFCFLISPLQKGTHKEETEPLIVSCSLDVFTNVILPRRVNTRHFFTQHKEQRHDFSL